MQWNFKFKHPKRIACVILTCVFLIGFWQWKNTFRINVFGSVKEGQIVHLIDKSPKIKVRKIQTKHVGREYLRVIQEQPEVLIKKVTDYQGNQLSVNKGQIKITVPEMVTQGNKVIRITAKDKEGNKSQKIIRFYVQKSYLQRP